MNQTHRKLWIHAGRHKTGSSAIQVNLYQRLEDPKYDYLDLGKPNASSVINNAFNPNIANAGKGDPAERAERARGTLRRAIAGSKRPNAILSAESISLLAENDFAALIEFLRDYFDDIELVAYFRPPKSDMESAFAEKLKTGFAELEAPVNFMHRRRFEGFENHLDKEKIHYLRYAAEDFPDGNVVTHFCRHIGITMPPSSTTLANERLSLPAVRLLYLYRKRHPQMRAEDRLLVEQLAKLQGPPLRFHSSLFKRKFQDPLGSFSWLESRSGRSFDEDVNADDALGIQEEADLEIIDTESCNWLAQKLGLEQSVLGDIRREPSLLADLLYRVDWVKD